MPWQSDTKYIWTLKHPENNEVIQAIFSTEESFLNWKNLLSAIDDYIEEVYGSK